MNAKSVLIFFIFSYPICNHFIYFLEEKQRQLSDSRLTYPSKLFNIEFRQAKMKGMKIFNNQEIKSQTGLEKMRRQFWNEKAELLCTRYKTANLSKNEIRGLSDTAWCLRKTSILVDDARKLELDEHDLFASHDNATLERGSGKQKHKTIINNVSRVERAHQNVLNKDKELESCKEKNKATSITIDERKKLREELQERKALFDGTYTELRRAQDALTKALINRRTMLDKRIKENTDISQSTSD
jgi:hypothetical protein